MNKKHNIIIGLALNLIVVILEIIGLVMSIQQHGWGLFQFYTQDSNIVAMLACGLMAVNQLLCLTGKKSQAAESAVRFKYIAVCLLMVTFLVVIFVLAPTSKMGGYKVMLFHGTMLYHHFLCPIIAFVSLILFESDVEIRSKDVKIALVPTIIYAVTAVILNVLHVMTGPYPFLMVYNQPFFMSVVWFILIIEGAYIIAGLIRRIMNAYNKSRKGYEYV
ncbi:MAG: Pr6Pr family membrane protein [Hespellia sp.]|nr:Pr6Pr family membrane protein [Hespellia sp.]